MNDYEMRLARVQAKVSDGIECHHRIHGTTVPPADRVVARSIISDHLLVEFPVTGDKARHNLGMQAKDDIVHAHDIERIVARATMWLRWHARIPEVRAELPAELARLTRNTGVEILTITDMGVMGTEQSVTMQYFVDVRQLDGSLRPKVERWCIHRHEIDAGASEWVLREDANTLAIQRKRTKLLRESGGRPNIAVERALATRLSGMSDRAEASRKLFAAAHGQIGTKVPWRSITLLEARDGRIVGTIPLSNAARIRDDTVTVKGAVLPEAVATALRGRGAEAVADHELLRGRTIKGAKNRKDGLVVELERDDVEFMTLRRTLDGED